MSSDRPLPGTPPPADPTPVPSPDVPLPPDPPPKAPPQPERTATAPAPPHAAVEADSRLETSRQLPPHRGKVGRISDHVAALSNDVTEWVELRIELAKAEVREKVEEVEEKAKRQATPLVFFAAAGVVGLYLLGFFLTTLAWAVAWMVGDWEVNGPAFWGFLVVTLLLALVAGVLLAIGKRKQNEAQAIEARLKSREITESDHATSAPPSARQYQEREAERARRTTA